MKAYYYLTLLCLILLVSCGKGTNESKQVEQLSYDQTIALIFPDSSNVDEWHGAPLSQEAMASLKLFNGEANGNCGTMVMLTNSSDKPISTTVSTVFPFTDSPWEVSKDYIISAGATVHVGNSKICHGDKGTNFDYKIQGASYGDD